MENYFEEKLKFIPISQEKSIQFNSSDSDFFGIKIKLGNQPLVQNLMQLSEITETTLSATAKLLYQKKDIYLISHKIAAIRLEGKAKVKQLSYFANATNPENAQTLDLLPNTNFKEFFKAESILEGSISANGHFSASLPSDSLNQFIPDIIPFGADSSLQLSMKSSFLGKISLSCKSPVVQSEGIASNGCSWVLNQNDDPLLGDQILLQTIAVPKKTKKIEFEIFGSVTIKGAFKKDTLNTSKYIISVDLMND